MFYSTRRVSLYIPVIINSLKQQRNISTNTYKYIYFTNILFLLSLGYCDSDFSGDISSLCDRIESDSVLFFMFRQQKNNTLDYKCPFDGVHTFSYSTRHGNAKCSQPPSHIDSCTDKTKMVFKFQACPDVPGSESSGELNIILCLRFSNIF